MAWIRKRGQIVEAYAECHDCSWTATSKNAQGIAAQHARKHGHNVTATVTMSTVYAPRDPVAVTAELEEQAAINAVLAGADPDEAVTQLRERGT